MPPKTFVYSPLCLFGLVCENSYGPRSVENPPGGATEIGSSVKLFGSSAAPTPPRFPRGVQHVCRFLVVFMPRSNTSDSADSDGYVDEFETARRTEAEPTGPLDDLVGDLVLVADAVDPEPVPTDDDSVAEECGYADFHAGLSESPQSLASDGAAGAIVAATALDQLDTLAIATVAPQIQAASAIIFSMDAIAELGDATRDYNATLAMLCIEPNQPDSFPEDVCGKMQDHVFRTILESTRPRRPVNWKACADAAVVAEHVDSEDVCGRGSAYKDRYLEAAESTYASSRMLTNGYVRRQLTSIDSGDEVGLLLLFDSQADEASKQMRVADETSFSADTSKALMDTDSILHAIGDSTTKRKHIGSVLTTAKVQYSELGLTFVCQDRAGEVKCTHITVPCHLQHLDRTTAENLHSAQEALLDIESITPAFMQRFRHVGWVPCQDKSSANEKSVRAGLKIDSKTERYGGKQRFRIPTACDIHGWARVITTTHSYCQTLISGLIAWAVEEQGADRLARLRAIVGQHLANIAVIMRIPRHQFSGVYFGHS